jgi:DNA-binding beta-propeller fold protein YncE
MCVAAVLRDAQRRVSVLGGREGMPRSLGSVYGGAVALFLSIGLRGAARRVISTPGVRSATNGVAVSRDGATLLVADFAGGSHAIHVFSVVDGSLLRVVGGLGSGRLQFACPQQLHVAGDGTVFTAERGNHRVQVLTPDLAYRSSFGSLQLRSPTGVCANADVVVVAELEGHRLSVFLRSDGSLITRFGSRGSKNRQFRYPRAVCFLSCGRRVAVADSENHRVSVLSVSGTFVFNVGLGVLKLPHGVACTSADELVVADTANRRVRVFDSVGTLWMSFGGADFTGVAVHGGSVFAQSFFGEVCTVWT